MLSRLLPSFCAQTTAIFLMSSNPNVHSLPIILQIRSKIIPTAKTQHTLWPTTLSASYSTTRLNSVSHIAVPPEYGAETPLRAFTVAVPLCGKLSLQLCTWLSSLIQVSPEISLRATFLDHSVSTGPYPSFSISLSCFDFHHCLTSYYVF